MRRHVAQLLNAKSTLKDTHAIKTMASIFLIDNTPEVIALNTSCARIAHRLHMKKWRAGQFSTKLSTHAIVVGSFIAIHNHKVLSKHFAFITSRIKHGVACFGKCSELLC
ncbi:hypothetical protein D9M70_554150 [compost metagenome]